MLHIALAAMFLGSCSFVKVFIAGCFLFDPDCFMNLYFSAACPDLYLSYVAQTSLVYQFWYHTSKYHLQANNGCRKRLLVSNLEAPCVKSIPL